MDYNKLTADILESIVIMKSFQGFIPDAKKLIEHTDEISDENTLNLFFNLIVGLYSEGKDGEVVFYCNKQIDFILSHNQKEQINKEFLKEAYFKKGQALSRIGDSIEAEKAFDYYVSIIVEVASTFGFVGDFYSFRKIDRYSLSDLIKNVITVVSPKLFNDPSDCAIFDLLSKDKFRTYNNVALNNSYSKVKFRSFLVSKGLLLEREVEKSPTKEFIMWSHYADSHRGMCIKYKISPKFPLPTNKFSGFFTEKYTSEPLNVEKLESINFETAFITKQDCWSYEKEIRFMHYNPKSNADFEFLPLDEDSGISAIYFGLNCTEKDIQTIMKILENKDVTFYRMKKNPENIYDLVENVI